MSFKAYAYSVKGEKKEVNQDYVGVFDDLQLFVLADGMGGTHLGGEFASRFAIEVLKEFLLEEIQNYKGNVPLLLEHGFLAANFCLYEQARKNPLFIQMGTTLTSLLFLDNALWLSHVGDTRCYRVRRGEWEQLTLDHSQTISGRRVLSQAVGYTESLEVEVKRLEYENDDFFVILSDGISEFVTPSEFRNLLLSEDVRNDRSNLNASLIRLAKAKGSSDDLTSIMVEPI